MDLRDFGESGEDGNVTTDFELVPAKKVSETRRDVIKQIKTSNNFDESS